MILGRYTLILHIIKRSEFLLDDVRIKNMHGRRLAKKIVSLFIALVLMLAFTPAPSVQAQGVSPWTKHNIDIDFNGAWGIYVYDIDDDGNPDVVATAFTADDVVWYEAPDDPTGTWTKHNIDINLDAAFGVYVYDIDDDYNPDVVAAGFEADDIVWYEAPDDPTDAWTKHNIDTELDYAWEVYVYDIDDDGDPDVVVTGNHADAVVWYEAPDDPTGSWTKHNIDTSLDGAAGVYVYDIDGDGNPDVFATGKSADDVVWYEAPDDPTGSWTKHNIDTELATADGIYVYDIDGDGTPDVVAAEYYADDVVWCRIEWESYKTDYFPVGEVCNTFSSYSTEHTVYVYGAGFASGNYKIIFWEGTTTKRQVDLVSAQNGVLKSKHIFVEGTDNAGTWYAGVYDAGYDPSSYTENLIWGDTFEVEEGAIPEFPTVITAIVVAGLCFGIYYCMRKRMMAYVTA